MQNETLGGNNLPEQAFAEVLDAILEAAPNWG